MKKHNKIEIFRAIAVLNNIGKLKPTTSARRRSKHISEGPEVRKIIKACLRAVMRNPGIEVIEQLHVLHGALGKAFASMPDAAIEWLLGGSGKTSRGGFQDTQEKSAVAAFREFLATNPKKIKPQTLITKIETIASAMGYRSYYSPNTDKPHKPDNDGQKMMDDKIQSLMKAKMVRAIGDVYTDKPSSFIALKDYKKDHPDFTDVITADAEDVSSASEVEEESKQPKIKMDFRIFKSRVAGTDSWPKIAYDNNVPVRCHASGTAPLLLAAMDGLFALEKKADNWFSIDKNVKTLSAVLVIATFERADFHTIAESSAGVNHYLHERAKREHKPMHPSEAFQEGLDMLRDASSSTPRPGEQLSLYTAVSIANTYIMDVTTKPIPKEVFSQDQKSENSFIESGISKVETPAPELQSKNSLVVRSLITDGIFNSQKSDHSTSTIMSLLKKEY